MTKITRRYATVTLQQGNYEQDLLDLREEFDRAVRAEVTTGRRASTKSKPAALAIKHDAMQDEADATAVKVTVWAISNTEWDALADEHPAREDDPGDKARGLNMKTFPVDLLCASLPAAEIEGMTSVQDRIVLGRLALREMDLSRLHYTKLETAAWNVNVGDDNLGKFSLVSLLKQERDSDSKQPSAPA